MAGTTDPKPELSPPRPRNVGANVSEETRSGWDFLAHTTALALRRVRRRRVEPAVALESPLVPQLAQPLTAGESHVAPGGSELAV